MENKNNNIINAFLGYIKLNFLPKFKAKCPILYNYLRAKYISFKKYVSDYPKRRETLKEYKKNNYKDVKLHLGCGDIYKEGYIGVDIRKAYGVDVVANIFDLENKFSDVEEIYTWHMVEHLTVDGARRAFKKWNKILKTGGKLHIVVPNLEFHFKQYMNADWKNPDTMNHWRDFPEAHAMHSLYGWQRDSVNGWGIMVRIRMIFAILKSLILNDRHFPNEFYWDTHKSGYTKDSITMFLKEAGFSKVEAYAEENSGDGHEWNLHAIATK